jgi:Tat protein secretion system quality control protein TatD with DNase activity
MPHIARTVAQLRGESFDLLAETTTRNAAHFFGLKIGA